jgi:hypothetical protein
MIFAFKQKITNWTSTSMDIINTPYMDIINIPYMVNIQFWIGFEFHQSLFPSLFSKCLKWLFSSWNKWLNLYEFCFTDWCWNCWWQNDSMLFTEKFQSTLFCSSMHSFANDYTKNRPHSDETGPWILYLAPHWEL